jgi:hypothetical protein
MRESDCTTDDKIMTNQNMPYMTPLCLYVFLMPIFLSISACGSKMAPVSITGYNHTKDRPIAYFTVNGAMGSNINQESAGGESCCVSIPYNWRPGITAKIAWKYDSDQGEPNPPPPSQEIEIDIPKYKVPGRFQVHFYNNHKIKMVISGCSIEHPFYPMSKIDKLPWKPFTSEAEAIESQKRGGMNNDC